jgi:hypothetical protein
LQKRVTCESETDGGGYRLLNLVGCAAVAATGINDLSISKEVYQLLVMPWLAPG